MKRQNDIPAKGHAIVMGATSGIGREVALLLAQKGWLVAIAGRRTEMLEKLRQCHKNIKVCRTVDVNTEAAPQTLREMAEELGGMDLYVHSSGIGWQNAELDLEKELLTANTNAVGFTRMVANAFNMMAENGKGGHIVCVTSIAGTKGLGAAPAYSATKRYQAHYLECLTQLAHIRKLNISITDIRPGFVDTPLIEGSDFPMKLSVKAVAKDIVRAIEKRKTIRIIDWRYRLLVWIWRMIPRAVWTRMRISG